MTTAKCPNFNGGFVPQDKQLSYLTSNGVNSCTVTFAPVPPNVVTLAFNNSATSVTYHLVPAAPITYYTLAQTIVTAGNVTFTFTVDTSQSTIGDQIWIFMNVSAALTGEATLVFSPSGPTSPWFISFCGNGQYGGSFTLPSGKRLGMLFIFDGTHWINTLDNC